MLDNSVGFMSIDQNTVPDNDSLKSRPNSSEFSPSEAALFLVI